MSETDDTDILLLIPPNFFLVNSSGSEESLLESSRTVVHKPSSCTAQVIGKLVNQVYSLESRLESLEYSTDTASSFSTLPRRRHWDSDTLEIRSLDRKYSTFPRRRRRKFCKKDRPSDRSLTSLDSITNLKKIVPPLKFDTLSISSKQSDILNDSPNMDAMDGDISSIVSTPNKRNDKLLLHEIDEFLTKVESYEYPDTKYNSQDSFLSSDNVIKATGDYIAQKLETNISGNEVKLPSGRVVPSNILDKYIYLLKNSSHTSQSDKSLPSTSYKSSNTDRMNESGNVKPVENSFKPEPKSPSVRKLIFADHKDVQPTSTPKKSVRSTSYSEFCPTSNKIYDRATKVLEQYKLSSYSRNNHNSIPDTSTTCSNSPKKEFKMPQMRPFSARNKEAIKMTTKYVDTIDTDLLSLSDLWGEKEDKIDKVDSIKLEEERVKREHCEAMIQQLQRKILEQQEKLAVALKVDRAKDAAINKLKEAWLKLTGGLDKTEERHQSAMENMAREVDHYKTLADDAQKKTHHFESELYKALDLAHDYQEKCKQLTLDMKACQEKCDKAISLKDEVLQGKEKEIEVLKENYDTVMTLNKQSTECVKNLEEALSKEKSEHQDSKTKCLEVSRKLQSMIDEATLAQQEKELVKDKVNEERARCSVLEKQLIDAQNRVEEISKKCETLDNESKSLRKHLELQKTELKAHYQKQLEEAVLAKLQEFQEQLDRAEREMETEARGKENAIVDTFNKQLSRVEEQHKLEVNVLEEKQKEEIKLCRLQLAQANEKIGFLESKLDSYRRRRGELASQLHAVMQTQWRQALGILTQRTDTPAATPLSEDYPSCKVPPLTMPRDGLARERLARDGLSLDGLARDGVSRDERKNDKVGFDGLSDNELHQYIKLLLTKPANLNEDDDTPKPTDLNEEPTSDRPEKQDRKDKVRRSLSGSKPPWKS